jgi:hypothetical protein
VENVFEKRVMIRRSSANAAVGSASDDSVGGRQLAVGQVANTRSLGQSTASERRALLRRGGLRTATRDGKLVRYRADPITIAAHRDQLQRYLTCCRPPQKPAGEWSPVKRRCPGAVGRDRRRSPPYPASGHVCSSVRRSRGGMTITATTAGRLAASWEYVADHGTYTAASTITINAAEYQNGPCGR